MEKKFSLEEFVNKCNNCTYQINNSPRDDSKKLAFDFNTISEWEKIYGSIENVAEDISMVVKRFFDKGITVEQVAERMDVPVDYVKECLQH